MACVHKIVGGFQLGGQINVRYIARYPSQMPNQFLFVKQSALLDLVYSLLSSFFLSGVNKIIWRVGTSR